MTKDRLNELKATQNDESATLLADGNNDGHLKIEIASKISKYKVSKSDKQDKQNNIKGNKELNNVYDKVKQVKEWIEQIEDDTIILKKIQSDILQSVFNTSNRAKLDEKMNTIKTTSKKARAGLKELFNIKSSLEHKDGSSHRLILRILSTQHPLLQKQYINAMTEYQDALVTHKQKTEQLIRDQLQIVISRIKRGTIKCVPVDRDLTNEEFEKILGNQDVSVFVGDYIQETMETRQKLNDARLRHKELLQLEMSIMELHEMLIEMATLVENQGETIDRIENYVSGGVELVENGKLELMKAKENKDKARKKKIYLITCLVTVLLLLIIIVVADFYFSRST